MDFTKNKILGFTVFLSLMMGLAPSHALGSEITEVFPNVFVMMGGEKKGSNSTFIITAEGVIVIDTRHSPTEAEKILTAIRKRTDLPVKFAINTSFLGDHVYGNQVFSKTGVIIAHNLKGSALHRFLESQKK